jgi:hypothetical protein
MVLKRSGFSLWEEHSVLCTSVSSRLIAFCISIDTCYKLITAVFTVHLYKQRDVCIPFPQTLLITVRQSGPGTGFSSNTYCTSGFPLTVIPAVVLTHILSTRNFSSWQCPYNTFRNFPFWSFEWLAFRTNYLKLLHASVTSFFSKPRSPVGTNNTWLHAAGTRKKPVLSHNSCFCAF